MTAAFHERVVGFANSILERGRFESAMRLQSNEHRARTYYELHHELRAAINGVQDAPFLPGDGAVRLPTKAQRTSELIELLRRIQDFGLWRDLQERQFDRELRTGPHMTTVKQESQDCSTLVAAFDGFMASPPTVLETLDRSGDACEASVTPLLDIKQALASLYGACVKSGWQGAEPVMQKAASALLRFDNALKLPATAAGIDNPSPGPFNGEFYQADHGSSYAITTVKHGVIALMPHANLSDFPDDDDEDIEFNAYSAPREPFDIANFRRLIACVNACDGIPTAVLERLRPDVEPFLDNCAKQFVIYSEAEFDGGDLAGFWNNDDGWTELESATRFTQEETVRLNLPSGSEVKWTHITDARRIDLRAREAAESKPRP